MLTLNRLGLKKWGILLLAGTFVMLTGCCNQCRQACGPCTWPNTGLDIGVFQSNPNFCRCNPCQKYNPCHPFGNPVASQPSGNQAASDDWGYAGSDYLSSAN